MRHYLDNFIVGFSCVGVICGLAWSIFLPKGILLSMASIVVGLVYRFFTED